MDDAHLFRHPKLIGPLHRDDAALDNFLDLYNLAATSAVNNMTGALRLAGRKVDDVQSVLDFGSGHGRVVRLLSTTFGPEKVTASDIREDALDFCVEHFGVKKVLADFDFGKVQFEEKFDIIWVGSVFTHISSSRFEALLDVLSGALSDGGILVFTTLGHSALIQLQANPLFFGVEFPEEGELRAKMDSEGFCFVPYEWDSVESIFGKNYGVTLCTEEYVEKLVREKHAGKLDKLAHTSDGWESQGQDVHCYQRR